MDSSGLNLVLRVRTALARQAPLLAMCPPDPCDGDGGVDHCVSLHHSHADVAAALHRLT